MYSLPSVLVFVFVGLKPFRPVRATVELCEGVSGPGRNGRRPGEPIPFWPGSTPSALGLVPTPPANGGHPIPGAAVRSATYTVDDAHQARIT